MTEALGGRIHDERLHPRNRRGQWRDSFLARTARVLPALGDVSMAVTDALTSPVPSLGHGKVGDAAGLGTVAAQSLGLMREPVSGLQPDVPLSGPEGRRFLIYAVGKQNFKSYVLGKNRRDAVKRFAEREGLTFDSATGRAIDGNGERYGALSAFKESPQEKIEREARDRLR